ncbi:MAG: prepilin-type N-terminal cleavage/methylation domain-containing protein [Lachnospiraceae bacterium]|nr:prepilin-type N-terminal cleavage/methylation domain-containing protein [Lachnospiraceae bacterium]
MRKRLEALKKDQKGFTLVELIVVLVILAILAALLVPALLGYIDRAKESKYYEEARSIYTAAQAVLDEVYATTSTTLTAAHPFTDDEKDEINDMVTPTSVTKISYTPRSTTGTKDCLTIKELDITFDSADGTTGKHLQMKNGTWSEVTTTP